jgi:hypothetical protein
MSLILSGTEGLSDVDGSAATPAIRGTDANTGIYFPAADTIAFSEGGVESVRIDSSGNVGIGTTSPAFKLDVSGDSQLIYTGAARSIVGNADKTNYSITDTGGVLVTNWYNGCIWKTTTGTERMRIDSSGNLLVGGSTVTTNPVGNRVNGIALNNDAGFRLRTSTGNSYFGLNVTSGVNMNFYTDNGSAFVTGGNISTNGSTTAFNGTSDHRLKNNVQPLTNALDRVALLKPVKWTWKEGFGGTQPKGEGFIAHELAEIIPSAVTGEKDAVDEDGNPVYQGLDTRFLVATLTAAIQEQQALIQSLTTRITALETP